MTNAHKKALNRASQLNEAENPEADPLADHADVVRVEPLKDRVLVRRVEAGQRGIVLTDAPKSIMGVVEETGPECLVKKGDKVLFNSRWNDADDERDQLIQEADIFCVVSEFPKEAHVGEPHRY